MAGVVLAAGKAAALSVTEVLAVCACGFVLARFRPNQGGANSWKDVGRWVADLLGPCVTLVVLTANVDLAQLKELWKFVAFMVGLPLLWLLIGFVGSRLLLSKSQQDYVAFSACCVAFPNPFVVPLPIILAASRQVDWLGSAPEDDKFVTTLATLCNLVVMLMIWTLCFAIFGHSAAKLNRRRSAATCDKEKPQPAIVDESTAKAEASATAGDDLEAAAAAGCDEKDTTPLANGMLPQRTGNREESTGTTRSSENVPVRTSTTTGDDVDTEEAEARCEVVELDMTPHGAGEPRTPSMATQISLRIGGLPWRTGSRKGSSGRELDMTPHSVAGLRTPSVAGRRSGTRMVTMGTNRSNWTRETNHTDIGDICMGPDPFAPAVPPEEARARPNQCATAFWAVANPQILALFVGVAIALSPLKEPFVGSIVYRVLELMGGACIPMMLLLLGAGMAFPPPSAEDGGDGAVEPLTARSAAVILGLRFIVANGAGAGIIFGLLRAGFLEDRVMVLFMLLICSSPTAVSVSLVSRVQGTFEQPSALVIFYQYTAAIPLITVFLALYVSLLS